MNGTEASEQPLVSCNWLAHHLHDPGIRIIEVSSGSDDAAYREGHIPGAVWWYWKEALWHPTDREFATPEAMARRLERIGVSPQTTIVLYGDPVQYGTYAFWVLSMTGHPDIRLLNGGGQRWRAKGRPLSREVPSFTATAYSAGKADFSSRVGRDAIRTRLGQPGRVLLDARSTEEYQGERVSPPSGLDHGAERRGRIPGAKHLFFRQLLNEDDTFIPSDALRPLFTLAGATPDPAVEVVVYCRLSHRATLAWFAMRHLLGYQNVRVYDGSWTEWGSIVGFPIERR
jgi:thiosulfate/3-mercaptopyruvate sulfurtransferase